MLKSWLWELGLWLLWELNKSRVDIIFQSSPFLYPSLLPSISPLHLYIIFTKIQFTVQQSKSHFFFSQLSFLAQGTQKPTLSFLLNKNQSQTAIFLTHALILSLFFLLNQREKTRRVMYYSTLHTLHFSQSLSFKSFFLYSCSNEWRNTWENILNRKRRERDAVWIFFSICLVFFSRVGPTKQKKNC